LDNIKRIAAAGLSQGTDSQQRRFRRSWMAAHGRYQTLAVESPS